MKEIILFLLISLGTYFSGVSQNDYYICDPEERILTLQTKLDPYARNYSDVCFQISRAFVEYLDLDSARLYYQLAVSNTTSDSARHTYEMILSQHFLKRSSIDSIYNIVSEKYDSLHPIFAILEEEKAVQAIGKGRFAIGKTHLIRAIEIFEKFPNSHYLEWLHSQTIMMACLSNTDNLDSALVLGRELLNSAPLHIPKCHYAYARILLSMSKRFDEAEMQDSTFFYINEAIKILDQNHKPNDPNYALLYSELGEYYKEKGQTSKAQEFYFKAEKIALQNKSHNRKFLSVIYSSIASLYRDMLNNKVALKYYDLSIQMLNEEYGPASPQLFIPYTNMGNSLMSMKEYASAERYLDQALVFCLSQVSEHHIYTAIVTGSIASNASEGGDFDKAEKFFKRSLAIRDHLFGPYSIRHANIFINMSVMYRDKKLYNDAQSCLEKGRSIYENKYGKTHPEVSAIYNRLGLLYSLQNQFENAIDAFNRAISAGDHDNKDSEIFDPLAYLTILQNRGDVYLKLYQQKKDVTFLTMANDDLDKADKILTHALNSSNYEDAIVELSGRFHDFFGLGVSTKYAFYTLKPSEQLLEDAWNINNKSKSVSIRKSLASHKSVQFHGLNPELKLAYQKYRTDLLGLTAEKKEKEIEDILSVKLDSIVIVQSMLDSIDALMRQQSPEYFVAMRNNELVDIANLQQRLSPTDQILDFFVTEDNVIVFNLSLDDLDIYSYPIDESIRSCIKDLTKNEYLGSFKNECKLLNDFLYDILKSSIYPSSKNLIIIPDNFLSSISFESIQGPNKKFLVEDYAISYAHSISIFQYMHDIIPEKTSNNFAGFAPIYDGIEIDTTTKPQYAELVRSGNMPLPFAQEEITNIKSLIGGNAYLGKKSKKVNILASFSTSKIVHLSMHTLIDNANPLNSRFILNDQDNSLEDLFLYELYNIDNHVELVVLSACETGTGKKNWDGSEYSLGNALLHSGIPATIISLWKVPDQSTSQIMLEFYKNLKSGQRKDDALQNAKIHFLKNVMAEEQKDPFYWAGFILVGNTDPIKFNNNYSWLWLTLVLSLFVLLFLYRRNFIKN